jgi:hypothetical protein
MKSLIAFVSSKYVTSWLVERTLVSDPQRSKHSQYGLG